MKVKAMIWDIGAVLFLAKDNSKPKNLLSSYTELCLLFPKMNMSAKECVDKTFDIYMESTRGDITKKEHLRLLSEIFEISPKKVEILFEKTINENVIENKELFDLIFRLKKKGYKMGILSTQQHLSRTSLVPEKYYEIFDAMEISCDDGLRKPDPKAFHLILKRLDAIPEETLFVDDKQENVDAAEKLGMNALTFQNNKQFFSDLEKLGIK